METIYSIISIGGMKWKQTIVLCLLEVWKGSNLQYYIYWNYEMKANYNVMSLEGMERKQSIVLYLLEVRNGSKYSIISIGGMECKQSKAIYLLQAENGNNLQYHIYWMCGMDPILQNYVSLMYGKKQSIVLYLLELQNETIYSIISIAAREWKQSIVLYLLEVENGSNLQYHIYWMCGMDPIFQNYVSLMY